MNYQIIMPDGACPSRITYMASNGWNEWNETIENSFESIEAVRSIRRFSDRTIYGISKTGSKENVDPPSKLEVDLNSLPPPEGFEDGVAVQGNRAVEYIADKMQQQVLFIWESDEEEK